MTTASLLQWYGAASAGDVAPMLTVSDRHVHRDDDHYPPSHVRRRQALPVHPRRRFRRRAASQLRHSASVLDRALLDEAECWLLPASADDDKMAHSTDLGDHDLHSPVVGRQFV